MYILVVKATVGDMHLDGADDMHLGGEDCDYLVVDRCTRDSILEVTATAGDMHLGGEYFVFLFVDLRMQDFSFEQSHCW